MSILSIHRVTLVAASHFSNHSLPPSPPQDHGINGSLIRMYHRFKSWRQGKRVAFDPSSNHRYRPVRVAEAGVEMSGGSSKNVYSVDDEDNQLDGDDLEGMRA